MLFVTGADGAYYESAAREDVRNCWSAFAAGHAFIEHDNI